MAAVGSELATPGVIERTLASTTYLQYYTPLIAQMFAYRYTREQSFYHDTRNNEAGVNRT